MKPVVLIIFLMAVAALSCNKKDTPSANKINPYKHKVRLRETLTITDPVQQRVRSRKFKYNEDGYLSNYRYVDSIVGNAAASRVWEYSYIRTQDNRILMEVAVLNSSSGSTIHQVSKFRYNMQGDSVEVLSYRNDTLFGTTSYIWQNGLLSDIYSNNAHYNFTYNGNGNVSTLNELDGGGNISYYLAGQTEFDDHVNVWSMIPGNENVMTIFGHSPEFYSTNNPTSYKAIGGRHFQYQYDYDADGYVIKSHNYETVWGAKSYHSTLYFYESAK